MEYNKDIAAVAFKMLETLGDQVSEGLSSIVTANIAAEDDEGAIFWADVAHAVHRFQAAISIVEGHCVDNPGSCGRLQRECVALLVDCVQQHDDIVIFDWPIQSASSLGPSTPP